MVGCDLDVEDAGAAHVEALVDAEAGRRGDQAEVLEVAAEGRRGRAGRRVLDDAARWERVAGVEELGALDRKSVV